MYTSLKEVQGVLPRLPVSSISILYYICLNIITSDTMAIYRRFVMYWISDPMKSYTLIISFVQKYIISTLNRFSTKTELSIPRFTCTCICRSFNGNKFPDIFGFLKDLSIVRGKCSYHLMAQFNAVSSDSIDNNDKEKPPL